MGPRDETPPQPSNARAFFRVAVQRLEDAQFLLDNRRNTAAVYLAGYAVECTLKALLLSVVPRGRVAEIVDSFRGNQAHDFEWLKGRYSQSNGTMLPKEVARALIRVSSWRTVLRYQSRATSYPKASAFLQATKMIVDWSKGSL